MALSSQKWKDKRKRTGEKEKGGKREKERERDRQKSSSQTLLILDAFKHGIRFQPLLVPILLRSLSSLSTAIDHKNFDLWLLWTIISYFPNANKKAIGILKKKIQKGLIRNKILTSAIRGNRDNVAE